MNALLRNTIEVKGINNAIKVAKVLLENEYQVMIQFEDCDIYIVSYELNDTDFGGNQFASLTPDEVEDIWHQRNDDLE